MQPSIREQLLAFFELDKQVLHARRGELQLEGGERAYDFLSQYGANPFGGTDPGLQSEIAKFLASGAPSLCQPLIGEHVDTARQYLRDLFDRSSTVDGAKAADVFFTQSGAESVELAIKIARAATLKPCTIALEDGFHGKTTGAVQLTANDEYSSQFRVGNEFVRRLATDPNRDLDADFAALSDDGQVNAVILEFVQGEGGMRVLDRAWVQRLVELARSRDILVIADEVQTGLGRTGAMLACEHYDVQPDLLLLAKALGAGIVPIGALIARDKIVPPEFSIFHSSTFANNNFTCFVAARFMERLPALVPAARESGAYLGDQLDALVEAYPRVFAGSSGLGLMRGVHLHPITDEKSYIANFCWNSGMTGYSAASWLLREQGILTMPCFSAPSCLRMQPPLTADASYIDRGITGLKALAELLSDDHGLLELLGAPSRSGLTRPRPKPIDQPRSTPALCKPATRMRATRKFQFTVHPLDARTCLMGLPPAADQLTRADRYQFDDRLVQLSEIAAPFSGEAYVVEPFRLGDTVIEGRLFAINYTARHMLSMSPRDRQVALGSIAASADDCGADVLGLGAFTSILAGGGQLLRDSVRGTVTAGSSLTAYAAVQAALASPNAPAGTAAYGESAAEYGEGGAAYGVVGAAGSIGALCWQMLLAKALQGAPVRNMTLFHNPNNPNGLANLVTCIEHASKDWQEQQRCAGTDAHCHRLLAKVAQRFATARRNLSEPRDVADAFARAVANELGRQFVRLAPTDDAVEMAALDRVLVSTNQTNGIAALAATRPGAELYDIGFPPSIDHALTADGQRTVYQSGLLSCPEPWEFGHSNIAGLPKGISLGCFGETITLAATDPQHAPSGARIQLAEAEQIGLLARSIGLTPTALATNTQHEPSETTARPARVAGVAGS